MPKDNRSFFERLTGSVNAAEEKEELIPEEMSSRDIKGKEKVEKAEWLNNESEEEGQLAVDVFQTPEEIVIQSVVAGVKPDDLDVSMAQDMITIRGKRHRHHEVSTEDCFYQELYWGGFSRSILLPQEVDPEIAEATLKNGLLTVRLPKLDKNRIQKLRVKNE